MTGLCFGLKTAGLTPISGKQARTCLVFTFFGLFWYNF